jgi:hypothetical protein
MRQDLDEMPLQVVYSPGHRRLPLEPQAPLAEMWAEFKHYD